MKPKKINDDILLIDEFLTVDELSKVKNEIIENEQHIKDDEFILDNTKYMRLFLDNNDLFMPRNESEILKSIEKLFIKFMQDNFLKLQSYTFQSIRFTNKHETQLTVYPNGGKYTWHYDNNDGRLISFILPININNKKWVGGELVLKYNDELITIEPKENQMIMFSAHLYHKVNSVKIDSDKLLDGRVVINGHIGY
jgi:Rps23 Pro-64 3,4-dihydroxylase Tpa1-like proline 4-hydroxylase